MKWIHLILSIGAWKSYSTHHFFGNVCTGSLPTQDLQNRVVLGLVSMILSIKQNEQGVIFHVTCVAFIRDVHHFVCTIFKHIYYTFFKTCITFLGHMSSPPVFSRVRVTRSLVLHVCFVDRCLSFCSFSFGHCALCSSSIYGL